MNQTVAQRPAQQQALNRVGINPMAEAAPVRQKFRTGAMLLMAAAFAVSWVPFVGGGLSHIFDRFKNKSDANHELDVRAKFYSKQVGMTLGMSPHRVTGKDLLKAASINPELRKIVREVQTKQTAENNTSLLINTGVTAASAVGLGGAAKLLGDGVVASKAGKFVLEGAKVMAGSMAGGAVAGALQKNELQAQELIEATEADMKRAIAEGVGVGAAINPHLAFMIRVAQDEVLSKQLNKLSKAKFSHPFHQLDIQQMNMIIAAASEMDPSVAQLAMAARREHTSIINGDMSLRDVAASAPNMGAGFAGPMAQTNNVSRSFTARLDAQRAAAKVANDNDVALVANGRA